MARVGRRRADDDGAQVRLAKPQRHVAANDAAPHAFRAEARRIDGPAALAGDHKHHAHPAGVRAQQERAQPPMGLGLAQPVQIQLRLDLHAARGNLARLAAIKRRRRR